MKKFFNLILGIVIALTTFGQDKKTVATDEFQKGIQDQQSIIIDVRRPEEFQGGHIKGAINANWQNPEEFKSRTTKLDKTRPVYLYCLGGVRSDKAADYLLKSGFKQVIGLEGGIEAWKEAGKPVVKP